MHIFTLKKIFRQQNPTEGEILNRIRSGTQTDLDLAELNKHVSDKVQYDAIVLTPRRNTAALMNYERLNRINSEPYHFEADSTGCYNGKTYAPLVLKQGCRIVVTSNSSVKVKGSVQKLVNGDTGVFLGLDKYDRLVCIRDRDKEYVYIKKRKAYKTSPRVEMREDGSDRIVDKKLGSMTQYPVRLAYCMTIHKSQGSTLNKVHIQMDHGKPFAPALLYVALSRVKSFKNLTISREVRHSDILPPKDIIENGSQHAEQREL